MTEVKLQPYVLPGVDIGPENPLPQFRVPEPQFVPTIVEGVPAEETKLIGRNVSVRVLPYRLQDGYNADKKPKSFDSVVLENDYLKAIFVPELGGHLMSLLSKPTNTELLDRNPVFQPRSLALRNAWISGGIEFNIGQLGHHYLTCSPIHACVIKGPDGEPGFRMYAWDRVKRFTYQMDFCLPSDSKFMYMHVRVVNPHDCEIPMYWWTNMGVPQKIGRRVLAPADSCIHSGVKGFTRGELPSIEKCNDVSYTTRIKHSAEYFFRMDKAQRRWITTLDESGRGFVQTSTDRLIGRKLFVWGTSRGGNRWQEYLAAPGSAYVEIQGGLTQTQTESIPMPANTEWTWTESFGLLEMEPAKVHGTQWHDAWSAADAEIEAALPRATVEAMHAKMDSLMTQPCGEVLAVGLGWGALERLRARAAGEPDGIPAELAFNESDMGSDQALWASFLESGIMFETDPMQEPGHFMTQPQWTAMLEKSVTDGTGDNWLGWYHLGVARMEDYDVAGAVEAWDNSLKHKRSGWALRNLAALELQQGRREAARSLYRDAWEVGPQTTHVAREYVGLLLDLNLNECIVELVGAMPVDVREDERIKLMLAWAKVRMDDYSDVENLLDYDFVSMREGEGSLASLWLEMNERKIAKQEGVPIDDELKARVWRDFQVPARIDYRTGRDVAEECTE